MINQGNVRLYSPFSPLPVRYVGECLKTLIENHLCREKETTKKLEKTVPTAMTQFKEMTVHKRAEIFQAVIP